MLINLLQRKSPLIMGVINATPDSFSDGGSYFDPEHAVAHGLALLNQGADILDIGGESTRPGAEPVHPNEEIQRIVPIIKKLVKHTDLISIDTRNAAAMKAALNAGAAIINDVSALTHDPESIEIAKNCNAPIILMHAQGSPQTMQHEPHYDNVVQEIRSFFEERIAFCETHQIDPRRIILDPGIGFGKTFAHNLEILKNLQTFKNMGFPLLLGTSRKSFIQHIQNGALPPQKRLPGSLASALWGMENGADILRVHDVAETIQAIDIWKAIKQTKN